MTMNSTIVPPDADAMETVNASLEFVAEARGEIARLTHGNQPGASGVLNRDSDGEKLYVGDVVIIRDRSKYDGWNGQIQSFGPSEDIIVMIGMPPGYGHMPSCEYEKLRRMRAMGTTHIVVCASCKLMNFII